MIRDTFSVLFYPKSSKSRKNGEVPIYCRITVNGKRGEFSIKRFIDKEQWDPSKGCVKGRNEVAKSINSYLKAIEKKLYDLQTGLIEKDIFLSAIQLKNAFLGKSENTKTLIEVFELHNVRMQELIGSEFAASTFKRYIITFGHVKEFLKIFYKTDDILLKKLDHAFITDFEFYLRKNRGCNNNSAVKYIRNVRKVVNLAIKNGWLLKDPFANFKSKVKPTNKSFLTENELAKLEKKKFSVKRLDEIRDIFVFCCYTGYAYADVLSLTPANVVIGNDGKKWINRNRQKTNVSQNVPLLPRALEIIEKYHSHPICQMENSLLPVKSNQKMNAYLKEVADLCGIEKNLTTHLARHTFATTVTLTNGVPIETVSKLLGHSELKTTMVYAKVIEKKVSEDMEVLKGKLSR